jgi:hypothetical protein
VDLRDHEVELLDARLRGTGETKLSDRLAQRLPRLIDLGSEIRKAIEAGQGGGDPLQQDQCIASCVHHGLCVAPAILVWNLVHGLFRARTYSTAGDMPAMSRVDRLNVHYPIWARNRAGTFL